MYFRIPQGTLIHFSEMIILKDILINVKFPMTFQSIPGLYRDMFPYMFIVLLTHSNNSEIISLAWGQICKKFSM